jgi:spermidine/putrescine-binding protein
LALIVALGAACGGGEGERPATLEVFGIRVASADYGKELHLFTWSDYLDPELVTEFENTYGVKVLIDYYDTNEAMIAKLQAGGTGQYDVVVASDYAVEVLTEGRPAASADPGEPSQPEEPLQRFREAPFDPGNVYSATYQWGTSGLGVRPDLATDSTKVTDSWAMVFDPASAVGPVHDAGRPARDDRRGAHLPRAFAEHQDEAELAEAREAADGAASRACSRTRRSRPRATCSRAATRWSRTTTAGTC